MKTQNFYQVAIKFATAKHLEKEQKVQDESGVVIKAILNQGGRTIDAKKVK